MKLSAFNIIILIPTVREKVKRPCIFLFFTHGQLSLWCNDIGWYISVGSIALWLVWLVWLVA